MADIEAQATDEHPIAIIGRGDSVVVKDAPTPTDDEETAKDFDNEIALIKESQVRRYSKFICANQSPIITPLY